MNNFHEYLIQHSLKSGDTKDHFRQLKLPVIAPYWKACIHTKFYFEFSKEMSYSSSAYWDLIVSSDCIWFCLQNYWPCTFKNKINYQHKLFCFLRNVLHTGRISSSSNVATAVQWLFSTVLVLHIFVTVVIATMQLSLACQGHNYQGVLQVRICYFAFIVYLKERFFVYMIFWDQHEKYLLFVF